MEEEVLREILKVCKRTEKFIKEDNVASKDKPIRSDIIKAKKAMAYEQVLEIMKKYSKSRK